MRCRFSDSVVVRDQFLYSLSWIMANANISAKVRAYVGHETEVLFPPSQVASDHGLEMVRKRGAQVLYGVAPPESGSQSSGGLRGGPGHVRRRTWSTASPASAISREPLTPPPRSAKNRANSPVNLAEVVGATPSPRTAVPLTNEPVFEDENSTAAGKSVAETAGGKKKGEKRRASLNKPDEEAVTVGTPELKGWRGTGGAGWGPWSHVDMQLVIGQASKHRVK